MNSQTSARRSTCGAGSRRRLLTVRIRTRQVLVQEAPGRSIVRRQKAQQILTNRGRDVQHDRPLRLPGPETGEVAFLGGDPRRIKPTGRDVERLPVRAPASGSFVQAAGPSNLLAGAIFDPRPDFSWKMPASRIGLRLPSQGTATFTSR